MAKRLSQEDYIDMLDQYADAWNKASVDAVLACLADKFDYRDPNHVKGIMNKQAMRKYLVKFFKQFPKQDWRYTAKSPHKKANVFSICYDFCVTSADETQQITGAGMERIEFKGRKICLDHIYMRLNMPPSPKFIRYLITNYLNPRLVLSLIKAYLPKRWLLRLPLSLSLRRL